MSERELDVRLVELLDVLTSAVARVNLLNSDDLNASVACTVPGSHFCVKLVDGSDEGGITELLVHVVGTAAAVVAKPHSKVLHVGGLFLVNFVNAENLSGGLLELVDLVKKVPESALSRDRVGSEDTHAEDRGFLVGLGGDLTSDNLEVS